MMTLQENKQMVSLITLRDFLVLLVEKRNGIKSDLIEEFFTGLTKLFKEEGLNQVDYNYTFNYILNSIAGINKNLYSAIVKSVEGQKLLINFSVETFAKLSEVINTLDLTLKSKGIYHEDEEEEEFDSADEIVFNLLLTFRRFIIFSNGKFLISDLKKALIDKVKKRQEKYNSISKEILQEATKEFYRTLNTQYTGMNEIISALQNDEKVMVVLDNRNIILLLLENLQEIILDGHSDIEALAGTIKTELEEFMKSNKEIDLQEVKHYALQRVYSCSAMKDLIIDLIDFLIKNKK